MNPYLGHPNPLQEGKDLFYNGLLSEAVLALEAEVLRNLDYAEGWRLLGITHAENDDDQQVKEVFHYLIFLYKKIVVYMIGPNMSMLTHTDGIRSLCWLLSFMFTLEVWTKTIMAQFYYELSWVWTFSFPIWASSRTSIDGSNNGNVASLVVTRALWLCVIHDVSEFFIIFVVQKFWFFIFHLLWQ